MCSTLITSAIPVQPTSVARRRQGLGRGSASVQQGAKTIKKNTNSTQNKSQTHRTKQYKVTSFLSTDYELSTKTCSKNVYSLGPRATHWPRENGGTLVQQEPPSCPEEAPSSTQPYPLRGAEH